MHCLSGILCCSVFHNYFSYFGLVTHSYNFIIESPLKFKHSVDIFVGSNLVFFKYLAINDRTLLFKSSLRFIISYV